MDGTDPCTQATQHGLACLTERGSFGQLRLYNHPAILMLTDAGGSSHQVVLTGLDGEQASIDLGESTHQVGARRAVALLDGRLRDVVAARQPPR